MRAGVKYYELSSVCTSITDGSHFSPKEDPEGLIPMLSVKDMAADGFDYTSCKYIGENDYQVLVANGCRPSVGDVLVAKDGSYLKTAFVQKSDKDQALLSSIAILTPKTDIIIPEYLALFFKAPHTKAIVEKHYLTGTAIKRVILKGFKVIKAPVPPLAEQERIVAELDLLQGIIDKQKAQQKELDTLAQSIFYDMFGDPVENDKGWEVKRLDNVGEIVSGSTPSTADDSKWDGNVNWVTPAELGTQLYYGATQRKITANAAARLTLMPVGTVLLSSRAPIGKLAITSVPMCCNQGFKNIICNESINNVFLYFYLMLTMANVQALGRGATFKEVSKQAISAYKTILPPLSLQQSFATKIEAIERQKASINASIDETQKLFDFTMDKYFG